MSTKPHEQLLEMNAALERARSSPDAAQTLATWRWQRPEWMGGDDGLIQQWRDTERLFQHGEVVWAFYIIANSILFEDSEASAPGAAVYSFDPFIARHPMILGMTAQQMGVLRASGDSPAFALRQAAWSISDDLDRTLAERVPVALTQGRVVFHSALFFPRAHIPGGRLSGEPFPAVALRRPNSPMMMLPGDMWPAALRDRWVTTDA